MPGDVNEKKETFSCLLPHVEAVANCLQVVYFRVFLHGKIFRGGIFDGQIH